MFVRLFRGTGIGLFILILISAAALWASTYLNASAQTVTATSGSMPLWDLVTSLMAGPARVSVIVSFILMLLMALLLIRFNISEFFINRRTFMPGILYVLLFSLFPSFMVMNPALPAAILIIAALWRMMGAYRLNGVAYSFFDAALMISTASLFYADAIWFLALVLIGTFLLRSPDIREITVALAGAVVPYAFLYAVWYLTNKDLIDLNVLILNNILDEAPAVHWGRTTIILLSVVGVNLIAGLYSVMADMTTRKVKSRKTFFMLLWLMAIAITVFVAVPSASLEIMAIAAIPSAFIISNYYVFTRKLLIPEILFALMIIMIVVARIWP